MEGDTKTTRGWIGDRTTAGMTVGTIGRVFEIIGKTTKELIQVVVKCKPALRMTMKFKKALGARIAVREEK